MVSKFQDCPSFFKLLMEENFKKQIKIPNAFTREFKKKLYKKFLLKDTIRKKLWSVRIYRKGDDFYICKSEWPDFVKDQNLKYGDFVLFFLVKKKTFEVIAYGPDCNRKFDVWSDEESNFSTNSDDGFYSSYHNEDDSNNADDDSGTNDENNDDDDYDDFNPSKGQSSRNGNSRTSKKFKRSRTNSDNETNIEEDEEEKSFNAFGISYNTNVKNPYFIKKLSWTHQTRMSIPNGFAREMKLKSKQSFTLQADDDDDRKWKVKIRITKSVVFSGEGWISFYKSYGLKTGDTCKFTMIKRLGDFFSVKIMRE